MGGVSSKKIFKTTTTTVGPFLIVEVPGGDKFTSIVGLAARSDNCLFFILLNTPPGYRRINTVFSPSLDWPASNIYTFVFIKDDPRYCVDCDGYNQVWLDTEEMATDTCKVAVYRGYSFKTNYVSLSDFGFRSTIGSTCMYPPLNYVVCVNLNLLSLIIKDSTTDIIPTKIFDSVATGSILQVFKVQYSFYRVTNDQDKMYVIMPEEFKTSCCVSGTKNSGCGQYTKSTLDNQYGKCNEFMTNQYCLPGGTSSIESGNGTFGISPTSVYGNMDKNDCQNVCNLEKNNCDQTLTSFCSTIDTNPNILNDIDRQRIRNNVCGCFYGEEVYSNYFRSMKEKLPAQVQMLIPERKECSFPRCTSATQLPYAVKTRTTLTCPNINLVSCIQDINIDNYGTVIGDIKINQTAECNIFSKQPSYSEWGPWGNCDSKTNKRIRSRTCVSNCENVLAENLIETKECSTMSDWSICSGGNQKRTCLKECDGSELLSRSCEDPSYEYAGECTDPNTNIPIDNGTGVIKKRCIKNCDGVINTYDMCSVEKNSSNETKILILKIIAGVVIISIIAFSLLRKK